MPQSSKRVTNADLTLLRIFEAVARCGGLAAAEPELNIGRSAISRYLTTLETRLHTTLCTRGRSGFALSEEGVRVLDAAKRLNGAIDLFSTEVSEITGATRGTLRICLLDKTATNPNAHIADAVRDIADRAPGVFLELIVCPSQEIEASVTDGTCQVGITPSYRSSAAFRYTPLFDECMYLYCGRSHPMFARADVYTNESEIRKQPYAGLNFHSPNMQNGNRLGLTRAADVSDQEALATLVLSGKYIAFLPTHYAAPFVGQGLMHPLYPSRFQYTCQFAAITKKSGPTSRLTSLALDCLRQAHFRKRARM